MNYRRSRGLVEAAQGDWPGPEASADARPDTRIGYRHHETYRRVHAQGSVQSHPGLPGPC